MVEFSLLAQNKESFPVQVKIENGTIEGMYNTHSQLQMYLGIPFAKPPVGDLRWKAPQPVDNWKGSIEHKSIRPKTRTDDGLWRYGFKI